MKKILTQKNSVVSDAQIMDFFNAQIKLERIKKESRDRVLKDELKKAIGDKKIVVSDKQD